MILDRIPLVLPESGVAESGLVNPVIHSLPRIAREIAVEDSTD
jgi:hypothetical protein